MIVFKSCVRCQGDVHVREDQYGQYLDCLQCGATTDAPVSVDIALPAAMADITLPTSLVDIA